MDVQTLMEKKDSLIDKIDNIGDKIDNLFESTAKNIYTAFYEYPSSLAVSLWIISFGLSRSTLIATICACLVYLCSIVRKYINHKIKKEEISLVDLDYIGLTLSMDNALKKRSVTDLIGEYVEDCFNRDVIFFRPLSNNDYISESEQEEMLTILLDSAATNLSPEVRQKLSFYVGEDNLHKIIARKALSIVTAFAATRNKNIYINKPLNSKNKK